MLFFTKSFKMYFSFILGIDIPTGFIGNVGITRMYFKKLPQPYSECVDNIQDYDSVFTKILSQSKYKYRLSLI